MADLKLGLTRQIMPTVDTEIFLLPKTEKTIPTKACRAAKQKTTVNLITEMSIYNKSDFGFLKTNMTISGVSSST